MRLALLLCRAALPGLAQDLTIGFRSALRLTSYAAGYGHPESRAYRAGPSLQVGLPMGFAIEAGALYSRLGYSFAIPLIGNQAVAAYANVSRWRAPATTPGSSAAASSSAADWNLARPIPLPENEVAVSLIVGRRVRLFRR